MKVLITGSKGFIGQNLVEDLKKEGHLLASLEGDISKSFPIISPFGRPDIIVHLAANTDTRFPDDIEMYRNNISSFLNVLRLAIKTHSRLIYASSASILAKGKPFHAYSHSKAIIDEIASRFKDRLAIIGLRFFNVYGPHEEHKGRMASMITQWALQIQRGKHPTIFEGSKEYFRDFVYVKDVVKAIKAAVSLNSGIYDVGAGEPRSFFEALNIVQEALNSNISPKWIPNPYPIDSYQTFTKANLDWGFQPDYSLEDGIKDYLTNNPPKI